jgi:hypothetical protein
MKLPFLAELTLRQRLSPMGSNAVRRARAWHHPDDDGVVDQPDLNFARLLASIIMPMSKDPVTVGQIGPRGSRSIAFHIPNEGTQHGNLFEIASNGRSDNDCGGRFQRAYLCARWRGEYYELSRLSAAASRIEATIVATRPATVVRCPTHVATSASALTTDLCVPKTLFELMP